MTQPTHQLIRRFFANLGAGTPDPDMFAPDLTAWTVSTRTESPGTHYLGATRVLASLFPQGLTYDVRSIVADDTRAAADVHGSGALPDGKIYRNDYAHLFDLKDGKITRIAEFFDPKPVEDLIMPLLMAAMTAQKVG